MRRTRRILERMPHFYAAWDPTSVLYKFLFSFGKRLDEFDYELMWIMRSHWVDTAFGEDLDKLAALFNMKRLKNEPDSVFRRRIKRAIIDYKGGGTLETIRSTIRSLLNLPEDYEISILENPPVLQSREFQVRIGDTWEVDCMSVYDTPLRVTMQVVDPNAKVINPTLELIEKNRKITYNGVIKSGDILELREGKAFLNGIDVSDNLTDQKQLVLPRGKTHWRYFESLEVMIGVFDEGKFDTNIFALGIPNVKITFEWVARLPAAFTVRLKKDLLEKSGVTLDLLYRHLERVKAAGVKAEIELL